MSWDLGGGQNKEIDGIQRREPSEPAKREKKPKVGERCKTGWGSHMHGRGAQHKRMGNSRGKKNFGEQTSSAGGLKNG